MEDERKDTELVKYEKYYSEEGLKDKITAYAKKAGSKVIYPVLLLFYVLQSKSIPVKTKMKIYGVLGYFILPADLIPDFAAGFGYTDDFTALIWVLNTISDSITPDIEAKAKKPLADCIKKLGPHCYSHRNVARECPKNYFLNLKLLTIKNTLQR